MKFGEKYELLESLTTGAIETFAANDRIRGERVLVHIVDCAPQKPDQTTAEWVLESFRRLAPEPPGPVLETGKYSGTKYAYVVTKPADETALKAWIRRYELQAQETKETRVHAIEAESSGTAAIPPVASPVLTPSASKGPGQAPGQMTQLFRDFDTLAKSKAREPIAPAQPRSQAGASTSLPGESGLHAAVPWDAASAKSGAPTKESPAAAAPASMAHPVAPELPEPQVRDSAKPGEFTSFFQGPFRGDRAADMPAFSSLPIEPPRKNVGEFTALFGQASPQGGATTPPPSSGPSFTGIFKDMESPKQNLNTPPVMPGVVAPPVQPLPSVGPMNVAALPDPVFSTPVTPMVAAPLAVTAIPASPSAPVEKPRPVSLPGDGATGAFMRPSSEPARVPIEAPGGPSPYTQIISRSKFAGAEEDQAGSAGAGKSAMPAAPKIPAAAPPMPKMPPPPAMPKIAAPPVPKLDVPAAPAISSWPLIITLTVLFFLAVILVLFFALKH